MADWHDTGAAKTTPPPTRSSPQSAKCCFPKQTYFANPLQLLTTIFFGCFVAAIWLLSWLDMTDSLAAGLSAPEPEYNFDLIKDSTTAPVASASTAPILQVFQVHPPVLTPSGIVESVSRSDSASVARNASASTVIATTAANASCDVLLMNYSFGYSYGKPFVGVYDAQFLQAKLNETGNYTPPACAFNRVIMNLTVTSRGRQFDRLALMYFGDSEVFRTSTAEPTVNGIEWTYVKDMTEFLYFWNSPQTLIFDLGNLIDSTYTGFFNTTLTASFFTSQETAKPADLILPISARQSAEKAVSVFSLPSQNASNTISFPRNANRAVFTVSACGQSAEEFWWGNVLESDIDTFDPYDGTLYGYSPFREVQVLIDGQLAGVQWPFPIIFTGGVVPGLWRPIVGIDAFDLREHEIDITPWLPVLSDGAEHTFEIRVAGITDNGADAGTITEAVGSYWLVTGKIFIWLDGNSSITTGPAPTLLLPAPTISVSQSYTQNASGANETLTYTTDVQRTISISSLVTTQNGTHLSTWTQSLSVTNYGQYTEFGAVQVNKHLTSGQDEAIGATSYKSTYKYPAWVNTSYITQPSGNFTLAASIVRGLDLSVQGTSVFPCGVQSYSSLGLSGSVLNTTQNGTAFYFGSPSAGTSSGYGSTSQEFSFKGVGSTAGDAQEYYYRDVEAVNGTVVRDYEVLRGVEVATVTQGLMVTAESDTLRGVRTPREILGRGPGAAEVALGGV